MTIQMQPVRQVPSPNYSARSADVRLIVIHDSEGAYDGCVAWFTQVRSQVSAHLVMNEDGSEVTQMVPLGSKAWHAVAANSYSIGIEGAGIEAKGFSDSWWRGMAKIVGWLLVAYDLPCRWAEGGAGAGYCSHHDLGEAGGGHSDPVAVGSEKWVTFGKYVQDAYDELKGGVLPAFALHGAPGPHQIVATPQGVLTPSHGGALRTEPADAVGAPPQGSSDRRRWIQQWLNAHSSAGLILDGDFGDATIAAICRYFVGPSA